MVILVKGYYVVKPSEETPKCIMYVSDFDHTQPMTHTPTVYFYGRPRPDSPLREDPLQILKHSLSKVLSIFYPLARRLRWNTGGDPSRKRVEINCNSAGALFFEADSDTTIDGYGEDDYCPNQALQELLPAIDYNSQPLEEQPLLLVQLTRFTCGGMSLGLRTSHTITDGAGAAHFVSEWARIARGEEPQNMPFLDRTVLKPPEDLPPPSFDHSDFAKTPLLIGQDDDLYARSRETTPGMFRLSKEQVGILKNKANKHNDNSRHAGYTRYEVVSSHLWRYVCKARGHEKEKQTVLRVPVSIRNRILPNLPKFYFGTAIAPVAAAATCGELLAEPLSFTCAKIRDAVGKVDDEYVKSCLSYLRDEKDLSKFRFRHVVGSKEGAFFGNPNLDVTSWLSLPLGGTDFGWGEDIYMGPGLVGYDGKSVLLAGRGDEEASVIVALSLQVGHVDAFKKLFYDDIVLQRVELFVALLSCQLSCFDFIKWHVEEGFNPFGTDSIGKRTE